MDIIRLLVALIYALFFSGLSIIVGRIIGIDTSIHGIINSKPLLAIITSSLLPLGVMLSTTWKDKIPKIEGYKENGLILKCEYTDSVPIRFTAAKEHMKIFFRELIIQNKSIFLEEESINELKYYITELNEKGRILRKTITTPFVNRICIDIEIIKVSETETRLNITIKSEENISVFSNYENRMLMKIIIENIVKMKKEGSS